MPGWGNTGEFCISSGAQSPNACTCLSCVQPPPWCRLRDLNDEINKLIREKGHWERRIVELGGPDYSLTRQKVTDADGKEVAAASGKGSGYRYFGAAKNLPGVKELFEKTGPRKLRRTRFDMHKAVDADYYGFRDEDDGILVKVEAEAEAKIQKRVRAVILSLWKEVCDHLQSWMSKSTILVILFMMCWAACMDQ